MLEQLIAFTNSEEYLKYYNTWTTEVHYIRKDSALKIVLELFNDLEDDIEKTKQVWEITCEDYWYSKDAEQYKRPFHRIKLYHPALWAFEDEQQEIFILAFFQ